jgi:hypothetical protein
MKKTISLFQRNYEGDRLVRNEVVPGAEWVLDGEGVATRKWDGTSCLLRGGKLYKRYDAKQGKTPPPDFEPAQDVPDPVTGHWPGWVPVSEIAKEDRWHREALANSRAEAGGSLPDWTYELVGPRIQSNPEGFERHLLIPHGKAVLEDVPRDYEELKAYLAAHDLEGIVWWRDPSDSNCQKVKIKTKDFGLKRKA